MAAGSESAEGHDRNADYAEVIRKRILVRAGRARKRAAEARTQASAEAIGGARAARFDREAVLHERAAELHDEGARLQATHRDHERAQAARDRGRGAPVKGA